MIDRLLNLPQMLPSEPNQVDIKPRRTTYRRRSGSAIDHLPLIAHYTIRLAGPEESA